MSDSVTRSADSTNSSTLSYGIQGYARTLDLSTREISADLPTSRCYWDFSSDVIAIVGKNGTGKSTILRELGLSLFPNLEVAQSKFRTISTSPIWAGGFVIKRFGGYFEDYRYPKELLDRQNELANSVREHRSVKDDDVIGISTYTLEELMSVPFVQGLDWADFMPAGTIATQFYRSLNTHSHPYQILRQADSIDNSISEEFFRSGLMCLVPHAFPSERGHLSERAEEVGFLPLRCALVNEDVPVLRKHFAELKEIYHSVLKKLQNAEGEYPNPLYVWDIADALGFVYFTNERTDLFQKKWAVESPLFNVWNLGGMFLWNFESEFHEVLKSSPSLIFDWPSFTGHSFRRSRTEYICSAVDPWLMDKHLDNVMSGIFDTAKGFHRDWLNSDDSMKNANSTYRLILQDAKDLMKEWGILPSWQGFTFSRHTDVVDVMTFSEEGIDTFGWVNDVTSRWASRALQIAIMKNGKYSSLPKILIWDEPELGLHPLALRRLADYVIPKLVEDGFKLIFATHSLLLAARSEQIYEAVRTEWNFPTLEYISHFDKNKLLELGFTQADELLSRRGFVLVEGMHDYVVLGTLYKNQLSDSGKHLMKVDGKENILTLPETELILALSQPITIVLDGATRSALSQEFLRNLNLHLSKANAQNFSELEQIVAKIFPISPNDEGSTLKRFLNQLLKTAKRTNTYEKLSLISVFMLQEDDILDYLLPGELWGDSASRNDWAFYKDSFAQYQKLRKKSQPNYKSFKTFCREHLGLPIDENTIKRAVDQSLDRPMHHDFVSLEQHLFGASGLSN